jgi:hypothetical protein
MPKEINISNEITTQTHLTQALELSSRLPYNSASVLYDHQGIATDYQKFGADCVGKLSCLFSNLPSDQIKQIRLYSCQIPHGNHLDHFASVINGYYIDPFIFQIQPLSLDELKTHDFIDAPTATPTTMIRAQLTENRLSIKLYRSNCGPEKYKLLEYFFDLDKYSNELPQPYQYLSPTMGYKFHYVAHEGRFAGLYFVANYNSKSKEIIPSIIGCGNWNESFSNISAVEAFDDVIFRELNVTRDELADYYDEANQIQKYLTKLKLYYDKSI